MDPKELQQDLVSAASARARFVGLKAYKAAGGTVEKGHEAVMECFGLVTIFQFSAQAVKCKPLNPCVETTP